MSFQLIPFVEAVGYLGIFAMIFAESGVIIGFFFPGDTLLFAAGLLASQGIFNIFILIAGAAVFAILGDMFGYWFGKKIGPRIFTRKDSLFFKREYIERSQRFFDAHGKSAIFWSRFMPIVRTFVPVVAGICSMRYKTFFAYNVIGGIVWCATLGLLGYFLGARVPNIDHYILPLVLVILVISFIPAIKQFFFSAKGKKPETMP